MQIIKYSDCGYVLKNNNNTYSIVTDKNKATRFKNGQAKNFIQNCVRKSFRNKMTILYEESNIIYDIVK